MQTCITCSMPLEKAEYMGAQVAEGTACTYCSDGTDKVKSCADIFEGGVQYFMGAIPGMDRSTSEKICRKNMRDLPYWKSHPADILSGSVATDEEFQAAMSKLS